MKILYGGSFDPIHNGHLLIIKSAVETFNPESVIIVPAGRSFSKFSYTFDPDFRLNLIYKAIETLPKEMRKFIQVSDFEIHKEHPVFTFETVLNLKPDAILLGGDQNYAKWKNFSEIIYPQIQNIIVYPRGNFPDKPKCDKEIVLNLPLLEVSSMEIQRLLIEKRNIDHLVPQTILDDLEHYSFTKKSFDSLGGNNDRC